MNDDSSPKLICLSSDPNCPCLILKWPQISVMLDCSLDLSSLMHFVPCILADNSGSAASSMQPLKSQRGDDIQGMKQLHKHIFFDAAVEVVPPKSPGVDFEEIDVILVANYRNMLALPFITEHTNFRGVVYATDPTLQFARLLMDELVQYVERVPKADAVDKSEYLKSLIFGDSSSDFELDDWTKLYSADELRSSLEKVKNVSFREILDLQGLLRATPVSSGYCIGSCNWILQTDYSKPLDIQLLANANVFILGNLSLTPLKNPDAMLDEFCKAVVGTVRGNGCVLVPCYASALLFDLLECLCPQLDNASLSHVPIYVVAHSAESSLALSNIYAEWLAEAKQAKVFIPEEPFSHGYLIKHERIKVYSSCYAGLSEDFKTPCIVFASHPSLRLGDSVHFMQMWKDDPKNLVVLTEPDFSMTEALSPYQPLIMKALFCPIDTRMTYGQANVLLSQTKPELICFSQSYPYDQDTFSSIADSCLKLPADSILTYTKGNIATFPSDGNFKKMGLDPELAASIELRKSDDRTSVGLIKGDLSVYANKLRVTEHVNIADVSSVPTHPYGRIRTKMLFEELKKAGLDPILEDLKDHAIIKLVKDQQLAQIDLSSNRIDVIIDFFNEDLRCKIREILLRCIDHI